MRIVPPALVAALLAILPVTASAQDDLPKLGIAFAQTASGGTWLCRHEDAFEGLACTLEHCMEDAPGEYCAAAAWCFPAGWSGVMTIPLAGATKTRVLCGMDNEAALQSVLAAICLSEAEAKSCALTLIVSPDGVERDVTDVTFAGGGAPPPEPAEAEPVSAATETDATAADAASTDTDQDTKDTP